MRKFRIPYIPYRSLLLSTTVLNDTQKWLNKEKSTTHCFVRNAIYRGDYIAEISMYNVNMLVFADETGKDAQDSIRRYGYAVQGQTP